LKRASEEQHCSAQSRTHCRGSVIRIAVTSETRAFPRPCGRALPGNRGAPRTLGTFCKGLMFSIRGAIVLFFAVVMGYSVWIIAVAVIRPWWSDQTGVHWAGVVAAFIVSGALVPWCFYDNWRRVRPTFQSINECLPRNNLLDPAQPGESAELRKGKPAEQLGTS